MVAVSLLGTTTYATTPDDEQPSGAINITSQETTSTEAPEAAPEKDMETEKEDGKKEDTRKPKRNTNSDKKDSRRTEQSSISWLSIFALVLGAGGVAIGALNLKNVNTFNSKLDKLRERNKKTIPELKTRIETLEQELSSARKKIEQNEMHLSRVDASMKAQAQSSYEQNTHFSQEQPVQQNYQPSVKPTHSVQEPVKLFCSMPRGGVFTNATPNKLRQSLYVITDNGGNVAQYSFVDGRDSAMVAARSTSDFLDPGCIISGNQNPNFTRVRTITPGTVRKTPNGWAIESKAVVELI